MSGPASPSRELQKKLLRAVSALRLRRRDVTAEFQGAERNLLRSFDLDPRDTIIRRAELHFAAKQRSELVRRALVDPAHPNWRAAAPMLPRIWSLVRYMHHGNMQITDRHAYGSRWWQWPLALGKWLLFWTHEGKHVICVANVLLWYPVFLGVVAISARALLALDVDSEETGAALGWALSYLPFALVPREMFIYHYCIRLMFGVYGLVLFIERHLAARPRGFCLCAVTAMAVFGFLKWCPFVYGLTTPDFSFLVWNNSWR